MVREDKQTWIKEIDFMNLWGDDEVFGFYWYGEDENGNCITSPTYDDQEAAIDDFDSMMEQRGYRVKLIKIEDDDGENK